MIDDMVVYAIVKNGLYMRKSMRRGKGGHTWTNNIRKARTYASLDEARKNVMEAALKYPYDENNQRTLEDAWIRAVKLVPLNSRYEIFDNKRTPISCGPEDVESDA